MVSAAQPNLGALIKYHRLEAGLTQEALAARAGMSAQGISALERGVRQSPYPNTLAALANALGLDDQERALLAATAQARLSGRRGGAAYDVARHETEAAEPAPHLDPSHALAFTPPLAGREDEMARVIRHLAGGGPPLLLLAGEPGIGKTRLLHETWVCAWIRGWRVLQAGCRRGSGEEPYAPLLDALERHLRRLVPARLSAALADCAWLVRLLPELSDRVVAPAHTWELPPERERLLIHRAIGRCLSNIAGPAGTLLLLDDLHWAGSDGLDLLAALARGARKGGSPLRMVGTYRWTDAPPDSPLATLLGNLERDGLAERLPLPPLAGAPAEALASVILREHAGELARSSDIAAALAHRIAERSGGVPYFIVGCAQELLADLAPGVSSRERHPERDAIPWNIAESVRQRIAALTTIARDVVGVASVVEGASARLLGLGAGLSAEDAMAGVETACQAGILIAVQDESYRFAYEMIREVVASDLGARRRRVIRHRVATALARDND